MTLEVQKVKFLTYFDIQAIPKEFLKLIGEIQHISCPTEQRGTSFVVFLHTDKENFVCKCFSLAKYKFWLLKEVKVMEELNAYTPLSISTYLHYVTALAIRSFIEDNVLVDAFMKDID